MKQNYLIKDICTGITPVIHSPDSLSESDASLSSEISGVDDISIVLSEVPRTVP